MARFGSRIMHAWNAFTGQEQIDRNQFGFGPVASYGSRPDRNRLRVSNERSIISSIYTRLGIDAASVELRHVRTNAAGRYAQDMDSSLNDCLRVEANIDQAARHFRQDIVMTLLDEGVAAIVPIDTTINPLMTGGYDILTMRVGKVVGWMPKYIRVSVFNEAIAQRVEIVLPKNAVAIVENPLYSVMNEPNSTLQRLIRKLNMLDSVDEQSSSGKLDLIIQLPYVIKSEARRQQAEQRRQDIEFQLKGSQYGIAYTDGTEKITQLNRPATNSLMEQVTYLTGLLYSQLGLTDAVMNGTANEVEMLNYHNRTIEPIVSAIVEAMNRAFLTKTARTQLQTIKYFTDPFKLVPIGGDGGIADIADKFRRNEIATANDIRDVVGWLPSSDPNADRLDNPNMPPTAPPVSPVVQPTATETSSGS